jgi:hypothetical protein
MFRPGGKGGKDLLSSSSKHLKKFLRQTIDKLIQQVINQTVAIGIFIAIQCKLYSKLVLIYKSMLTVIWLIVEVL